MTLTLTDHKPLVPMFTSTTSKAPPRIEKWILKLQGFDFKTMYVPGSKNSADYLSRSNPLPSKSKGITVEEYINHVMEMSIPIKLSLTELQHATKTDSTMTLLKECIITNKFNGELKNYRKVFSHLSIVNDLIMLDNKILIPRALRHTVLQLAHEGHQGIVKTKQRLRKKVWWPGMSADAEKLVESCHECK